MTAGHPLCDNLDVSSPAVPAAPAWRSRIVGSGEEAPDQLLANPSNWRTHGKAQRAALREVLDTVGYVAQVIVNRRTGHLVDGHLRVEEALSHGQPTIPALYVDLSEDEERLVLASLDPLAAMATTDEAKLRELLAEVSVSSEALAAILAALAPAEQKDGLTDPDDVPEPPDEAITQPGDLWLLGDHRLLCGDAGSVEDLDRLLAWVTVDLLLSDPPYNVRVEPRSNNAIAAGISPQWDAASGRKALDAQGLHDRRFDVARGKSRADRGPVRTTSSRPPATCARTAGGSSRCSSGSQAQRWAIQSRNAASLTSAPAMPRIMRSVSSGSPGAGVQVRPLRSTNSTVARNAQRLLPSGSGWFLTRCQQSTAALVAKSG